MSMHDRLAGTCLRILRTTLRSTFIAAFILQFGAASATSYHIDPKETASSFEVWMLGFIPVRGHFSHTTGMLSLDAATQTGSIEVTVDTASLAANSARAEVAARGPHFFDVEKYPRMDFKSSRFVFDRNRLHSIEGTLTLTGAARPVTLLVNHATCKAAFQQKPPVCRAEAVLKLKRSAFGMKAWSHSIGDDVTIRIALVAFAEAEVAKQTPATQTPPVEIVETPNR